MKKYLDELKRRNVIKASIGYIVAAWVLLQVLSIVLPTLSAPEWVLKTLMLLMLICFPIWIIFSWIYEVTPEGIKKTESISRDKSISHVTDKRLNIVILIGLVAAIAITLLRPSSGYISSARNIEYAIAVLPFDDMSQNKDTEWFCDGVTEDILTHLSKIKGLKVVSRTSTERYKNTTKSVPEIAAELGVSYVVEGSVRKHNDAVLITAQLINANDEHVWADNFNEKMKDVFKIQGEVSKKIVKQLKLSISPKEEKELNQFPTKNIEAYEAYLKGRSFLDKFDREAARTAIPFFKKAIDLDPNYADAYAELGFAKLVIQDENYKIESLKDFDKALDLNQNSSRANSYKGIHLYFSQDKQKEAITYLEKAINLNPNDAKAHDMIATYYSNLFNIGKIKNNLKKALYHFNEAVSLDPFSSQSNVLRIMTLLKLGNLEEAEKSFLEKKSLFSNSAEYTIITYLIDQKIQLHEGPQKEVIAIYDEAIKEYPKFSYHFYHEKAAAYDGIFNDQASYLKYAKMAYELDSTHTNSVAEYHTALIESRKFEVAEKLRNTANYKNLINREDQQVDLSYHYYHKGDYEKSISFLVDSLAEAKDRFLSTKAFVYAQMGDLKNVNKIVPKLSEVNKAMIYAILKKRDSMYYFLLRDNIYAQFPNSRPEMDPYRKEARYLEFLKKNGLPITE
tara:strand:- start:51174 stop:53210 length:2037 start_codon:yes stop_codon:yes gene_type:complete